ncbi:MAG: flavin reductase [Coprococcus sp.]
MNNKTMHKLSYGLFVLTAREGEKDNGCIVNTAIQLTSEPQMISVAVNKNNLTCDMIRNTKKMTVSILSEKADFSLFKRFGFQSGRDVDKFDGFTGMKRGLNDVYYITEGTNGFISAYVQQMVDMGTHILFIAQVTDMEVLDNAPSATYAYYQSNIKPKPEAVGKTPEGKTVWRCTVCGYEYVGDELPSDFICPLCKHPASDFEKVV